MAPECETPEAIGGADGDVRVRLRVRPGAKRNALKGVHGDRIRVDVQAPPVDGKANRELERFLAKLLGVSRSDLKLTAGQASRDKTISVTMRLADARRLLRV